MRMTRLAFDSLPQCRRHLTRAPPRSSASYANGTVRTRTMWLKKQVVDVSKQKGDPYAAFCNWCGGMHFHSKNLLP
jgi:hypothetical protein